MPITIHSPDVIIIFSTVFNFTSMHIEQVHVMQFMHYNILYTEVIAFLLLF